MRVNVSYIRINETTRFQILQEQNAPRELKYRKQEKFG